MHAAGIKILRNLHKGACANSLGTLTGFPAFAISPSDGRLSPALPISKISNDLSNFLPRALSHCAETLTMDPLSAIASVIAISQALGVGINGLQSLANAPAEFSDMLSELSALQACTNQLCTVIGTMSDPQLYLPEEVLGQLETINFELGQIVGSMRDIGARLSRGKLSTNRKGQPKVSVINWQLERSKATKLRDRSRRCRQDLSLCLSLLGVSEQ